DRGGPPLPVGDRGPGEGVSAPPGGRPVRPREVRAGRGHPEDGGPADPRGQAGDAGGRRPLAAAHLPRDPLHQVSPVARLPPRKPGSIRAGAWARTGRPALRRWWGASGPRPAAPCRAGAPPSPPPPPP